MNKNTLYLIVTIVALILIALIWYPAAQEDSMAPEAMPTNGLVEEPTAEDAPAMDTEDAGDAAEGEEGGDQGMDDAAANTTDAATGAAENAAGTAADAVEGATEGVTTPEAAPAAPAATPDAAPAPAAQ